MSDKTATETVYVTNEESHVMSEKVQHLAASVYKEFEKVIKRYDEEVVKDLMPLVVGILETLDAAFTEKQELDVEIELLRDDNEQLLTQYEREKQLRKAAEQKFLEMEDNIEEIRKELEEKVETLESIIRMSEIKAKNFTDHVNRLEEKEQEMKMEHSKLNERYLELLRNHVDYRERTKILMGTDKLSELSGMSPKIMKGNLHLHGVRPISVSYGAIVDLHNRHDSFDTGTPHSSANVSLKSELDAQTPKSTDKEQLTDSIDVIESPVVTKPSRQLIPIQAGSENISEALGSGPADTTSAPARSVIDQISSSQIKHETGFKLETELPVVLRRNQSNPEDEGRFVDLLSYEEDSISGLDLTLAEIIASTPELEESHESLVSQGSLNKRKSVRNDNSIFDELTEEKVDIAEVDFGSNITDSGDEHEENEEEEEEEEKEGKEDDENDRDSVGDNFFGIDKEVEKLIVDNVELMATKNALNIVKDDLIAKVDELTSEQEILRDEITSLQVTRGKLLQKITQLEEDLKKAKEEHQAREKGDHGEDDEEKVDFAQRKRFTRVEMARVLMERNQYKERLMELQEAVRWTEMIRATKNNPQEMQAKKKSSVWNFFSNLFSSSNKPKRQQQPTATVKYNAPTSHLQPLVDPARKTNPKTKAFDFLQEDVISDKLKKERIKERQEQYKQVQAHVKKDDGRMHAYGWSLPAKFPTHAPREDNSGKPQVPVPVPVYCRPLFDNQNGWKIWCAAGVNLTGGKTRDGGSIVGASVFYSDPPPEEKKETVQTEVDKLDEELKDHDKTVKDLETEQLSSLVWVCTAANEASRVSVIDANNPGDILETFRVSVSHILCIASIPGAMENDYPVAEEILNAEAPALPKETVVTSGTSPGSGGESSGLGGLTFVQCATGGTSPISSGSPVGSLAETETNPDDISIKVEDSKNGKDDELGGGEVGGDPLGAASSSDIPQTQVFRAKGSPASSGSTTPTHSAKLRVSGSATDLVNDGRASPMSENEIQSGEAEKLSSVLPTMWMGSHGGNMYVHSSVSNWKRCLHSVKLRDAVLGIVHVKGRVLVSLADGTVAIFHRSADGQWDLLNYHLIDLGKPKQSIRCMTVVAGKYVWCGYNNKVHIIDPQSMAIEKSFDAHPRKESLVRQLCWVGDGVWVSIRLDSTLRLYHAYTHQHLQDVDIEPYVSKMLGTGKLGFSFVRITSLLISCNRLWIGTGNGVIISVPLSENNKQPMITTSTSLGRLSGGPNRPGGVVRVYSDPKTESVTPGSFIPYCSMAQAQLSFHGHKDAVKFFVSVPGIQRQGMSAASDPSTSQSTPPPPGEALPAPPSNTRLILSGGEGYVDFRLGDVEDDDPTAASRMANDDDEDPRKTSSLTKVERSHIIVWQVTSQD